MKKEFLVGLGLESGVVDQIMTENNKDIEGYKAQLNVQKGLVSDLTKQVNDATTKISEFEKIDVNALTQERDSYKSQYEQALKDKDTAVAQVKYDSALDTALSKFQFTSKFAQDGIRSALVEKKLELKDGVFQGFDETMKSLQETYKDAFVINREVKTKPQFSSPIQGSSQSMTSDEYFASKYKNNPWAK